MLGDAIRPSHWLSFLDRVEKPSPESQDFGEFAFNRAVAEEMHLAQNITFNVMELPNWRNDRAALFRFGRTSDHCS